MQMFTVSSKKDQIRALYLQYGQSLIPATVIKEVLGPDVFKDLKGLRYIRKAGFISKCGTFNTHRTSSRDKVHYEATDAWIDAINISYRIDSCKKSCGNLNFSLIRCRRCPHLPTYI